MTREKQQEKTFRELKKALRGKKPKTAAELADKLGVVKTTVYDRIRAMEDAGIDIARVEVRYGTRGPLAHAFKLA